MAKNKAGTKAPPVEVVEPVVDIVPQIPPDIKHIRITLLAYKNITPTFSFSNLTTQAKFLKKDLGSSLKTQVTDEDYFPAHHDFVIECDMNSSKSLDELISNPVTFTVLENPGQVDFELMAKLGSPPKPISEETYVMSAESIADLAQAFTGIPVDRSILPSSKVSSRGGSKKEMQKSKSDTKNSKTKVGKEDKQKEGLSTIEFPTEPVLLGTTTLDLLPLFLGNTRFTETILIHPFQTFYDDRMVPLKVMPRLVMEVTVDEDDWFGEDTNINILSLTIESVYNIPALMSDIMQYKISAELPSAFAKWEPVLIPGGKLKTEIDRYKSKRWPGAIQDSTKYRIDSCMETIKNNFDVNLNLLNSDQPRIEWNILKRNLFLDDATREFCKRLKAYRHLPIELYVTSAKEGNASPDSGPAAQKADSKGTGKSDVSSKKGKVPEKKEIEDYLHLMAAIDVSTLLYPGVKKCRVACPLNTFQAMEILKQTGLVNSYFMPKVEPTSPQTVGTDKTRAKSDKGSKTGKPAGSDNKNDLKPLLPSSPVIEVEPSTPVYNEKGDRTFIIIEIELLRPLIPKREIEDLSEQLLQLLPKRPTMSKIIVSSRLAQLHYKDVIKELTGDLIHQYEHYIQEKEHCKCDSNDVRDSQNAFLTFLQRSGVYQTYLLSVTKAASVMANEKFPYVGEASHNNKDYQNFISETFSALIKDMNAILNELTNSGAETAPVSPLMKLDALLLYAREACEIGAATLADRYYLERLCKDDKNADCWFDYAVFQLEINDMDKAIECIKQCLVVDAKHQYGLLLCGILLSEKNSNEEAETCFLTAMFQYQGWLEGWGTMHLFYCTTGNGEGADLCLEMANKCLKNYNEPTDYFTTIDDLAWTAAACPHQVFYKTAVLLLKMRTFKFADKALARSNSKTGMFHYYLAVIMYYRHNYLDALEHLRKAERLQGSDYAIASLKGHCFLARDDLQNAKEEYMRVLESYDRPDDVHLLYIYLALISERTGDKQFARKLLLLTCKFSPTPYTWLATGLLYFGQKDCISAEQCLIQANLCDNRLPEIWGYLVLINLELHHYSEAELCYKQTKKNTMGNKILARRVDSAMKSLIKS